MESAWHSVIYIAFVLHSIHSTFRSHYIEFLLPFRSILFHSFTSILLNVFVVYMNDVFQAVVSIHCTFLKRCTSKSTVQRNYYDISHSRAFEITLTCEFNVFYSYAFSYKPYTIPNNIIYEFKLFMENCLFIKQLQNNISNQQLCKFNWSFPRDYAYAFLPVYLHNRTPAGVWFCW